MCGSLRRLATFWDFWYVSNAGFPSMKPYHIATRWMLPSWLNVATFIVRRSWMKASTSSSVIRIWSRRDMTGLVSSGRGSEGQSRSISDRAQQLRSDRAIDAAEAIGHGLDAARSDQAVDQLERDRVL